MQTSLIDRDIYNPPIEEVELASLPESSSLVGPEPTDAFLKHIEQHGVLHPIILEWIDRDGGYYEVHDGRRRIKSARNAGYETIPAKVYQAGYINGAEQTIAMNRLRSDNTISEYEAADHLFRMRIERGDTEKEAHAYVARQTGATVQTIKSLLKYGNLIPELRAAIECGKMMAKSAIQEATKLSHDQQRQLYESTKGRKKITAHDVDTARRVQKQDALSLIDLPAVGEVVSWKDRLSDEVDRIAGLVPESHATILQKLQELKKELIL